ncbi:EF-hand domain-containing protein [Chloroflexi bacterium TSY]|nr:EF-hand domain-containing protein [Chloroflexi bacterium TSY]
MTTITMDSRLKELHEAFETASGDDRLIDLAEFQKALGLRDKHMAHQIFTLFDYDSSGTVNQREFLESVDQLVVGSDESKLKFAFDLHDGNRSGAIDEEEMRQIITSGLVENRLDFSPEQVDSLVHTMFQKADTNQSGDITFDEFQAVVAEYPALLQSMTISPAAWLKPRPQESPREKQPAARPQKPKRNRRHYLQNNWATLLFLALYIAVNLYLFVSAVLTYSAAGTNVFVQVARGCGAMLNFNGALILIPMLRHLLTWLRQSPVNNILPIDESLEFHKMVGQVMFGAAIVHTIAHLINYATLTTPYLANLFGTKAGLTGFLLLIVFSGMWWTSQSRVRLGGHFKLFYLAHMGYVLWFALLLFHGPVF